MAVRLDKVLTAWRANPRPQATIELCNLLIRASSRPGQANAIAPELVVALGEEASARHPTSADALLAIAGLYITAGELERAEATLNRTAELAPDDPRLLKLMGKIRLHQGIRGSGFPSTGPEGGLPRGISFAPPPPVARTASDPGVGPGPLEVPPGGSVRQGSHPSLSSPTSPASWAPPLPPARAPSASNPAREEVQRRTSTRRGLGDDIPAPRAISFDLPLDPFPQALPSATPREAHRPKARDDHDGERTPAYGYELHEGLSFPMTSSIEVPMDREQLIPDDDDPDSATVITSMDEIMTAAIAWSAPDSAADPPGVGSSAVAPPAAAELTGPSSGPASGEPASDDSSDDSSDEAATGQHVAPGRPFAGLFSDYRKESTFSRVVESLWGVRPSSPPEEGPTFPEEQGRSADRGAPGRDPHALPRGAQPGLASSPGARGAISDDIESRGPDTPNLKAAAREEAMRLASPHAAPGGEIEDRRNAAALTSSPSVPPEGRAAMPSAASAEHAWRLAPATSRPAPPRSSRVGRALVVSLLLAGIAGGGVFGYFKLYPRFTGKAIAAKAAAAEIDAAILRGAPRDLAEADAALQRSAEQASTGRDLAMVRARERAARALDDDPQAAGLAEAVAHARALGAGDRELAFADVAMAMVSHDTTAVDAVLRRRDADGDHDADAFYELAAGAALEARGDAGAILRYRAAAKAEPHLISAELRLVRALLLYGDAVEGRRRALALAEATRDRPEAAAIRGLVWLVDRRDAAPASQVPDVPPPADLPRVLRGVGPAITLFSAPNAEAGKAALASAIQGADSPAEAVFFGALALAAGETGSAVGAAQRGLEMAPTHAPALGLLARASFVTGQLEGIAAAANKLPPAGTAEIRAVLAYEAGDFTELAKIAEGFGGTAGNGAPAILARRDRMLGAPISASVMAGLGAADVIGGDLLVLDEALDAGNVERARQLMTGWPDAATHALRALRWARLLRYEGKLDEARAALEAAAPTRPALIERLLLEAETDDERAHALAVLDDRLQPERPFFEAYLRARQGNFPAARAILGGIELPKEGAPLSLRLAAALALGEMHDTVRGLPIVQALIAFWPKNPDAIRAAVGLGILPRSLLDKKH